MGVRAQARSLKWVSFAHRMDAIKRRANALRAHRRGSRNTRRLADGKRDLYGQMGECIYALHHDLPFSPRVSLTVAGDGGEDYPGVDVKTSTYFRPILRVAVKRRHPLAEWYALVYADPRAERGVLWGEIHRSELVRAPKLRCRLRSGKRGPESYTVMPDDMPPPREWQ